MRRRHVALAALLALLLAPAAAGHGDDAGDPGPLDAATRDFDQLHLDIRVTPDLDAGTIEGRVRIAFESLVEGLSTLRLHAADLQVLAAVDDTARALAFEQKDGILRISLGRTLSRGDGGAITIAYRGTPRRGLYVHRPTPRHPDTPTFLYSQGQSNDTRHWIPCYDLPDDRFAWDLRVTVPDDLHSVSNGRLVDSDGTEDGSRTDHWRFEDRAPSYLISLVVAELATRSTTWRDVRVEYSAVPERAAELETALGRTPEMLEFFSDWLDEPYPWKRYAQTFVWDFIYGGMENVTATTLHMRALHAEAARPNYRSEGLVAHELAHMWFGDLITCRTWSGIWLNEGFATYLTDLYFGSWLGDEAFRLRRRSQNRGYMNGTPNAANLKLVRHPRGDRPLELFGGKQYARGAAILHMLRLELGDEMFQRAIRAYVDEHRDDTVATEDLKRVAERVAGRDLSFFFDQWVYGAGYPTLTIRWDAGRGRVHVTQTQEQRGGQGLFRFTLPVRAGEDGPLHRLRIWRRTHTFDLPDAKDAPFVRVGVGGDLLAKLNLQMPRAAWVKALALDPDVTGRLDAIEALEQHGEQVATDLGRALMGDPSWAVREAAAKALAPMDLDATAGAALLAASGDEDPRVRVAVYEALGGRTRDEAADVLLLAARDERKDYPRAAAAHALGRVQAGAAYDVLRDLLAVDSHDDVVRSGALDGLAALGDRRGAGLARTYLDYAWGRGGTHRVREAALRCMLALAPDDATTHESLVALLDDPYHRMRARAAEACGTYEVRRAKPRLAQMATQDPFGQVKRAAKKALETLK